MPQEELKRGTHFAKESAPQTPSSEASSSRDDTDDMGSSDYSTVGRSAGLMTILTIVSRVTGFIRTWAMAAAIGMSLLSSSYQVANNLPNMLYELVMGGMLVTAFLPVYMGVRREQGREASNEYVGNLLGMLMTFLGGAWMPLSLMGSAVQTVAHFVPTYWVNDAIGKALASGLTSTVLGDIACDLGVTVLFAAAIAAVGLALAHNKSHA